MVNLVDGVRSGRSDGSGHASASYADAGCWIPRGIPLGIDMQERMPQGLRDGTPRSTWRLLLVEGDRLIRYSLF